MAKLAIFAGHGVGCPGAKGVNGLHEEILTIELRDKVTALLRSAGHEVINDSDAPQGEAEEINNKVALANAQKVEFVVDLHFNATQGASGTEVYYSLFGTDNAAKNISAAISTAFGLRDRGAKTRAGSSGKDYFGIIRHTNAAAVLVETCFIDSADDMDKYNADIAAVAIAGEICGLYGGTVESAKDPAAPEAPNPAVNPYPTPTINLKKGSKGSGVSWIQWALKNKGYSVGKHGTDGDFGADTDAAVRKFQKDAGIAVDGIVGPVTRGKLWV